MKHLTALILFILLVLGVIFIPYGIGVLLNSYFPNVGNELPWLDGLCILAILVIIGVLLVSIYLGIYEKTDDFIRWLKSLLP